MRSMGQALNALHSQKVTVLEFKVAPNVNGTIKAKNVETGTKTTESKTA